MLHTDRIHTRNQCKGLRGLGSRVPALAEHKGVVEDRLGDETARVVEDVLRRGARAKSHAGCEEARECVKRRKSARAARVRRDAGCANRHKCEQAQPSPLPARNGHGLGHGPRPTWSQARSAGHGHGPLRDAAESNTKRVQCTEKVGKGFDLAPAPRRPSPQQCTFRTRRPSSLVAA
eukprot:2118564-Rhodomonas_salina.1